LTKHHAIMMYVCFHLAPRREDNGGMEVQLHAFLTSALDSGEWSASRAGYFTPAPVRSPGTHWIGGWVGLRTILDAVAKRKEILSLHRSSSS